MSNIRSLTSKAVTIFGASSLYRRLCIDCSAPTLELQFQKCQFVEGFSHMIIQPLITRVKSAARFSGCEAFLPVSVGAPRCPPLGRDIPCLSPSSRVLIGRRTVNAVEFGNSDSEAVQGIAMYESTNHHSRVSSERRRRPALDSSHTGAGTMFKDSMIVNT